MFAWNRDNEDYKIILLWKTMCCLWAWLDIICSNICEIKNFLYFIGNSVSHIILQEIVLLRYKWHIVLLAVTLKLLCYWYTKWVLDILCWPWLLSKLQHIRFMFNQKNIMISHYYLADNPFLNLHTYHYLNL